MSKKASVVTLGCAKNSVDSEHIAGSLIEHGITVTDNPHNADYIIINTCGFIEAAKQESISTILEAVGLKTNGNSKKVIVTGCLAQRYYKELTEEIPEVDAFVGVSKEWGIAEMIAKGSLESAMPGPPVRDYSQAPSRSLSSLPYAYLQIADGCDNRCSYCAIPLIRGAYRSKPIEQVLEEAHLLDAQGIREINLIAQDTGRYGYDLYDRTMLIELLRRMDGFTNMRWLRLLYLQPYNINDELIDIIKNNPLIVPYLDVPFQHASPNILRAMNRHGAGSDFLAQLAWIRRAIPEITIRSAVITGFPGETDEDFDELIRFVEAAEFDYLGIFEYSAEEGTRAATLENHVPAETIKERYHQLTALQDSISQARSEQRVGKTFDVLIEKAVDSEEDLFEGRAEWQAPEVDGVIYVSGAEAADKEIRPGDIVSVTLDEFDGCDYHGRLTGGAGK